MQVTSRLSVDRRDQILRATIDVVADAGYHGASFSRVIEHAGLSSTRLISYHFDSREALMREALAYVVARAGEFMGPYLSRATNPRDQLGAYIRSNLAFLAEHAAYARAAVEIVGNLPAGVDGADEAEVSASLLEQLFVAAQAAGQMRSFDAAVMAATVRAGIDAAVRRSVTDEADLARYADEMVEIFDRATRVTS